MQKASILVVDDEPIIRDTLAEFLQQERFAVKSCGRPLNTPLPVWWMAETLPCMRCGALTTLPPKT